MIDLHLDVALLFTSLTPRAWDSIEQAHDHFAVNVTAHRAATRAARVGLEVREPAVIVRNGVRLPRCHAVGATNGTRCGAVAVVGNRMCGHHVTQNKDSTEHNDG